MLSVSICMKEKQEQYNLPYVKCILVSQPFIMINLICRNAGIYVQQGNPHNMGMTSR